MAVTVASLQQTHKLLHHQEGDDAAENPQTHGHHVTVGGPWWRTKTDVISTPRLIFTYEMSQHVLQYTRTVCPVL